MSHSNNDFNHKRTLLQKRIRQAQLTVNALFGATVLSVIVTLSGVYLADSGHIQEGLQMAEAGMVSTVELAKQLKDANERLDQTIEDEAQRNK
ncbi:hypothetical protein HW132_16655 [Brasilonema sp. CT11]|nr:hypothetical protein [Brasilonema sp. CT11]